MKTILPAIAVILALCATACGGDGPSKKEAMAAIVAHSRDHDIVYEKFNVPTTAMPKDDRLFLDALDSAGLIQVGKCRSRKVSETKLLDHCEVWLTPKGENILEPARSGSSLYEVPVSYPDYRITEIRVRDKVALVYYVHNALPSGIRVDMAPHGYRVPLRCGSGVAIYLRQPDGTWKFERIQGRKSRPCVQARMR